MRKCTGLLLLLLVSLPAFCQLFTLKGTVVDSTENKNLAHSVISVLRKTDSVLVAFTRTDASGVFRLANLPPGKSMLLITHPKYADYIDEIDGGSDAVVDLGKVFMTLKSQLLQEVIVSNAGAIRIKGDTTEYKADSFHLKAGATVEDLLKKLPGIQVDRNGKITAQGETVQKVLVDGEEFFSDDPTIVTRNMLSDAVDKVQVYDKKSDQAAFTGIDDGQKSKTIDLKLKDNRKKGYFGKLELGSDGKKYWNNSGMLNAFEGKRKISAFGITSNTGKTGLDWREGMNYGSNNNMEMGFEDGGMYISINNSDDFDGGGFYGEGLPKGWNAGLHYSNKWNGDKMHLNSGLQYKKLNIEANGTTQSKYILPDTLYYINERGNSFNSKFRTSLNGTYEFQLDSGSTVKVTGNGYSGGATRVNNFYSESLDELGRLVNSSQRQTTARIDDKSINSTLLFRKKFKKQGRTISLNMRQSYTSSVSDGFLKADYSFYDENGNVKQQQSTDQQKLIDNTRSSVDARVVYTEPLSKRSILEFNYSVNNNLGRSSVNTLEKTSASDGKYEQLIDSLSNEYSLNVLTNAAGINYRYARPKKINFSFGGNISRADFRRTDLKTTEKVSYDFINFFPRANLNLTLRNGGNLSFNYFGNTQAPSVDQIQPVKDNTNELYQRIGNPDLRQAFRQRFSVYFNQFKLLAERALFFNLNYSTVDNDFSNFEYVDEIGRRISQPVNVSGNYSFDGFMYYSKKIRKPAFQLGMEANFSFNRNTNFINTLKNVNNSLYVSVGPRLSFEKEKKYNFTFSPRATRNRSTSSIRPDEPTRYWTQEHNVEVTLFFPWKLELYSETVFNLREKTDAFDRNNNVIRWNMRLDKKFLKNDAAVIRISAFDLLNQNISFDRNINSNFISERSYDTFRRYFMLSFIYNFNKNGKPQ